ncbi:MAG: dienelactone hydrolase family protein, partial [Alphaproteobacteria bacterium]|nr:dienelactone hydrolase family protein [Alphaproteobacteria bacterium]
MYDEEMIRDEEDRLRRSGGMTRREFGALSVGAGMAMLLPRAANALAVTAADIEMPTPAGVADCHFVHPANGAYPGVLVWPDALGLRPAFKQVARRLAESGYAVLVVNPYYRTERAPILPEGASFRDEATRQKVFPLMRSLTPEKTVADARAFVGFLDGRDAVAEDRKMGTTGYCMGGAMTMRTAAAFPERIGAGASFHGGRLVTDKPDSPHLLVGALRA